MGQGVRALRQHALSWRGGDGVKARGGAAECISEKRCKLSCRFSCPYLFMVLRGGDGVKARGGGAARGWGGGGGCACVQRRVVVVVVVGGLHSRVSWV